MPTPTNKAEALSYNLQTVLGCVPSIPEAYAAKWLSICNESDEDFDSPIYDELTNTVRVCGAIVDAEIASLLTAWGIEDGYVSPNMLRDAINGADEGYALEVNSPGGDVFAGTEMVSLLRQNPPESVVVTGIAASMAAEIILVAEDRQAGNEMALVMYHAPWGCFCGNAKDVTDQIQTLLKIQESFIDFIGNVLPKEATSQIADAFTTGKDLFYTASEAVEAGILVGVVAQKSSESDKQNSGKPATIPNTTTSRNQQVVAAATLINNRRRGIV